MLFHLLRVVILLRRSRPALRGRLFLIPCLKPLAQPRTAWLVGCREVSELYIAEIRARPRISDWRRRSCGEPRACDQAKIFPRNSRPRAPPSHGSPRQVQAAQAGALRLRSAAEHDGQGAEKRAARAEQRLIRRPGAARALRRRPWFDRETVLAGLRRHRGAGGATAGDVLGLNPKQ